MTQAEERLFMLDLAVVQLITGILVTLGATLFAISIGFGLSIPPTVKEMLGEILMMRLDGITEVERELLQTSINNYLLLLASVGILLIIVGVIFASAKMNRMKKGLRKDNLRRKGRQVVPATSPDSILANTENEMTEA